jgi:hypothetical protein
LHIDSAKSLYEVVRNALAPAQQGILAGAMATAIFVGFLASEGPSIGRAFHGFLSLAIGMRRDRLLINAGPAA